MPPGSTPNHYLEEVCREAMSRRYSPYEPGLWREANARLGEELRLIARHKLAGFEPPTGAETVKAVTRGIRRAIGAAPVRKSPATADVVTQMLRHCPDTLTGLRGWSPRSL